MPSLRSSLFACVAVANAASLRSMPVMKLRGGLEAGGLDAASVGKYYTMLLGVDGAVKTLSQSTAGDFYGTPSTENDGLQVFGYYLLVKAALDGTDTSAAVVTSMVPSLVGAVKGWLNSKDKVALNADNLSLVITGFLAYALHTSSLIDGDLALKLYAGYQLVNGLGGWLMKDAVANLPWSGCDSKGEAQLAAGIGAAVYALATGKSANEAVGYSAVPALLGALDAKFVSNDAAGDDRVNTIMTLVNAAVVAFLLF